MTLKDVLISKDPKVKYAKKAYNETDVERKESEDVHKEEQEEQQVTEDTKEEYAEPEIGRVNLDVKKWKSIAGYGLDSVKLDLLNNVNGKKDSVEILDWEPSNLLESGRRSSLPVKELSRKSRASITEEKIVLQLQTSGRRSKKVIVEPLSPVNYRNISLHEEVKCEKDEEGIWSGHASSETHEDDHQLIKVNKEDIEFIKGGQEMLSLILRILRVPDYSGFEMLHKAKTEEHKLSIYYDHIQKPNSQTIIRLLWSWIAPCSADKFIQFNSDFEQQRKVDVTTESAEEIEEIYASETESYVINYLSYKRVLISSPRDLVYLKHLRKLGQGEWAEASVSIKHEDFPEFKDRTRSEILCAGSLVSEMVSGDACVVKCYSEIDFKANIPSFVAKSFIKLSLNNYVTRCISTLKSYN